MAWLKIEPVALPSTVTLNFTTTEALIAKEPPFVPVAPVPTRTRTVRVPAT